MCQSLEIRGRLITLAQISGHRPHIYGIIRIGLTKGQNGFQSWGKGNGKGVLGRGLASIKGLLGRVDF